jgi:hypothetical protein
MFSIFIFVAMSFTTQKFFILVKFHLSATSFMDHDVTITCIPKFIPKLNIAKVILCSRNV